MEILAPAGGQEQLVAAVRCGADAVYLGAGGFNARRNAENFGGGALEKAVGYCHARGVLVHVTVNTLVTDRELGDLDSTIQEVAASGADAVITQDLAVMANFRDRCPDIKRHASTQMTVHNLDGAKMCADMGFSRVVLARELTLREIERISAHCGIETEVFIHGALCMCMSGACYLSAMLGGRSGNRGLCAQPCRLDFRSGERHYALSLKDMSHIDHIKELENAGVASLKIEGRMKRPEYVAAAVTACRVALTGEPYDRESLRAVFSRSGFTDGYLTGKRDLSMFGHRSREDVTAADKVLRELANLYKSERQAVPVDMTFTACPQGSALRAAAAGKEAAAAGPVPERARTREMSLESVRGSLEKTGGTPFYLRSLVGSVEPGLAMAASAVNQMRRQALEELLAELERPEPKAIAPKERRTEGRWRTGETQMWGRFRLAEQLTDTDRLQRVILPVEQIKRNRELILQLGDKLTGELPALCFDGDGYPLDDTIRELRDLGLKSVSCGNIYGLRLAKEAGMRAIGDFGLNIMNSIALDEYASLGLAAATLSIELKMSGISSMAGSIPSGIISYGHLPLMRFRNCPAKGERGCGQCRGGPSLTDRKNVAFPLECGQRRYSSLLNSVPIYLADKSLPEVDFHTLYFTTETAEQARRVIEAYGKGETSAFPYSRGLYYRGVE